jgi:hypothetical protein
LLDIIGIENRLTDLIGHPVDLVEEGTLGPRVGKNVNREIVRAFWCSDPFRRFIGQRRTNATPKKLRHTGEGRCPSRKWVPAFAGKTKEEDATLNHLNVSEH